MESKILDKWTSWNKTDSQMQRTFGLLPEERGVGEAGDKAEGIRSSIGITGKQCVCKVQLNGSLQ